MHNRRWHPESEESSEEEPEPPKPEPKKARGSLLSRMGNFMSRLVKDKDKDKDKKK